jgi:hypothetical protein
MRILLLALLIFLLPFLAWSHPGKTDSIGGHKCYKGCEKWELFFGEYHLHDKEGKPIRVAKKMRKKHDVAAPRRAAPVVQEEKVEAPQPMQAAVMTLPVRALQPETSLSPSPLMLLLLVLLFLLLLVKRRAQKRQ